MSSALQVVVPQHVAPHPAGVPGDDDSAHQRLRSLASDSGGGGERKARILAALGDDTALPREELQLLQVPAWCRSGAGGVAHLVAQPRDGERYYCVRNPFDNSGSQQCLALGISPGLERRGGHFDGLLLERYGMDHDGDHAPPFARSVAAPTSSPLAIGAKAPERALLGAGALPTGEEIAAALRRFSYSREGGGRRASLGDSFILPPEQTEVEAEIFCVARRFKNIGSCTKLVALPSRAKTPARLDQMVK